MPVFITHGRFTEDAIKGMLARPEDRAEALGNCLRHRARNCSAIT